MWFNCSCVGTRPYIMAQFSLLCLPKPTSVRFCCRTSSFLRWRERLICAILGSLTGAHLWFAFSSRLSCRGAQALICLLGDPSPWMRKAQSVSLTAVSLPKQCHVAHSECLPRKQTLNQPWADRANSFCYPSCVTAMECLNVAQHCAVQVSCNLHGSGREEKEDAEEEKGGCSSSSSSAMSTIPLHTHAAGGMAACTHATASTAAGAGPGVGTNTLPVAISFPRSFPSQQPFVMDWLQASCKF